MSSNKKKSLNKWVKPTIRKWQLSETLGKFDNSGIEILPGNPGGGLVGPGS